MLTEKCVVERNCFHTLHVQIIQQVRIQVKEHRHIHRLSSIQSLLLKAEALNLAKVRGTLSRGDTVCRNTNDVLVASVGGLVEGKGSFAGENTNFALLGDEFPGKLIGH